MIALIYLVGIFHGVDGKILLIFFDWSGKNFRIAFIIDLLRFK